MQRLAVVVVALVIGGMAAIPAGWAQDSPARIPIAQWEPLPAAADVEVSADALALRERLLGDHWDDPDHVTLHWIGVSSFVITIRGHLLLFDAWEIIGAVVDYLPVGREELAGLEPEAILVGHGHFDHAGDLGYVAGLSGAAVVGSEEICDVAVAGALREGVGTGFACAVTGTATSPVPGTLQTFRMFADVAPVTVLQHLHSAPELHEDNQPNPFLPIMDVQPYLDHFAADPDELARFLAQQVEQDQGGTWMYHLVAGEFMLLVGDSAGPIFTDPDLVATLEGLAGCVDVLANAILGFDQPVSGLQDPVLYVAATRPQVFIPTHADAWAPVISAGQAQYEDELLAEMTRQDVTGVEVDMLLDPDDYLVERAFRVDDPRWAVADPSACPASEATAAPPVDPGEENTDPGTDDRRLPDSGGGLGLAAAVLVVLALAVRRGGRPAAGGPPGRG